MIKPDFWRQLEIIDPSDVADLMVTLIGAGGIGSPTALALGKMGVKNLIVYDSDRIESHNLPNQLYRLSDLGKPKTQALADGIADYAGVHLVAKEEKFTHQPLSGVVISGVDSMAARKTIWQQVKYNPAVELYIEARMGAEMCRIHTVRPTEPSAVRWYETTLYSDEQAMDLPCTARAIIYTVFVVAGLIVSQVKKYVRGQDLHKEIIFDLVTLTLLLS